MDTYQIIFLVIAIAIVVLVAFIVRFLCKAEKTLTNLNVLSEDLNSKMQCIHPFFRMISVVGEGLEYRAASLNRQHLFKCCSEESRDQDIYLDVVDCALLSLRIWKKMKDR